MWHITTYHIMWCRSGDSPVVRTLASCASLMWLVVVVKTCRKIKDQLNFTLLYSYTLHYTQKLISSREKYPCRKNWHFLYLPRKCSYRLCSTEALGAESAQSFIGRDSRLENIVWPEIMEAINDITNMFLTQNLSTVYSLWVMSRVFTFFFEIFLIMGNLLSQLFFSQSVE